MKELFKKYREVITYIFFGGLTSAINVVLYAILVSWCALDMTLSNGIAWFGAVVFAFITNKLYVFQSSSWRWKTAIKEGVAFFGSRILSGMVEIFLPTTLFYIGINQAIFGIEGFLAKIIVTIVVIILNYILSKAIVFRK